MSQLLLLILSALVFWWIITFIWTWLSGGPYTPIPYSHLRKLLVNLPLTERSRLVDLGSGDGRVLIEAARHNRVICVGYELHPLVHLIASLRVYFKGLSDQITLHRRSYFDSNLSDADVVFVHLLPHGLRRLLGHLRQSCRSDTLIVSYGVPLQGWKEESTLQLQNNTKKSLFPGVAYLYYVGRQTAQKEY